MRRLGRMTAAAGVALSAAACAGDAVTAPVAPAPQVSAAAGEEVLRVLRGRVEGIRLEPAAPGAESRITLCRLGGLSGSPQPLFVADGEVVRDAETHPLRPEDVASIKILTGPNAARVYGPGAENGVVLIRTKAGAAAAAAPHPAAR